MEPCLTIVNFDELCMDTSKNTFGKHGNLLPNSIRCIICGPSNCGKSNLMLNLLLNEHGLRFKNIYIFSKTLFQPKYVFLSEVLSSLKDIGYFQFTDNDQVVHPNDVLPDSIMIFDDVSCEKQYQIRNYFTLGRHNGLDTFYLTQTYSQAPKRLIRDNANLIVLYKINNTNLKHVYFDHVNTDMTYEDFKKLCAKAWDKENGFMVIDTERSLNNGRYRSSFNNFFTVEGDCN